MRSPEAKAAMLCPARPNRSNPAIVMPTNIFFMSFLLILKIGFPYLLSRQSGRPLFFGARGLSVTRSPGFWLFLKLGVLGPNCPRFPTSFPHFGTFLVAGHHLLFSAPRVAERPNQSRFPSIRSFRYSMGFVPTIHPPSKWFLFRRD